MGHSQAGQATQHGVTAIKVKYLMIERHERGWIRLGHILMEGHTMGHLNFRLPVKKVRSKSRVVTQSQLL